MSSMPSPELRPGAAEPLISAERNKIVVADDLRISGLLDGDEVVERNHLSGIGAQIILVDMLWRSNGIGLRPERTRDTNDC